MEGAGDHERTEPREASGKPSITRDGRNPRDRDVPADAEIATHQERAHELQRAGASHRKGAGNVGRSGERAVGTVDSDGGAAVVRSSLVRALAGIEAPRCQRGGQLKVVAQAKRTRKPRGSKSPSASGVALQCHDRARERAQAGGCRFSVCGAAAAREFAENAVAHRTRNCARGEQQAPADEASGHDPRAHGAFRSSAR